MTHLQIFSHPSDGSQCFINARELHASLNVGRDFSHWIQDRIEKYGFVEGVDYRSPNLASGENQGLRRFIPGGNRKDYHLTVEMAKELALLENNDTGRRIRRQLLDMERALREDVPAVIRKLTAERDAARRAVLAVNPEWAACWRYRELGLSGTETAKLMGKSATWVGRQYRQMRDAGLDLPAPRIAGPRNKALMAKGVHHG